MKLAFVTAAKAGVSGRRVLRLAEIPAFAGNDDPTLTGYPFSVHLHHGRDGRAPVLPAVKPNERNGWRASCRLMVDKISTVPKSKVGARLGRLDDEDIVRGEPEFG